MHHSIFICCVLLCISATLPKAEDAHFSPEQEISYHVDSITTLFAPVSALVVGDDSLYSGSGAGIYAKLGRGHTWQKIIKTKPDGLTWMGDCYKKEQLKRLFWPGPMWILPGSNRLMVYDCYCYLLTELEDESDSTAVARIWRHPWEASFLDGLSIQGDIVLSNGTSNEGSHIDVQKVSDPNYFRRIFMVPLARKMKLDSVGIYWPNCRPVMNPADSTIWVEIYGFEYIYIIDFKGALIDSVAIKSDGWIPPGPPVSRIKSQAVANQWRNRWTPQVNFNYAPPGYFIMQYRVGWEHIPNDSIPLYGTAVWDASSRQPVELQIDPHWQVAGVQSDGRVIFGHYEYDADSCRVVLDITRIEK